MKIGVDIGGSHISIGVVNENYQIIEKKEKSLKEMDEETKRNVVENYLIINLKEYINKYKIEKVCLSIPGTIYDGVVKKSVNLEIDDGFPIKNIIESKLNIPISVRNDAKCAALAESKIGSIKDFSRSVFLTLGTGIGGAVVINNELLDAGKYPGCEFGHMIIEKDGKLCSCGKKGCFEKYASMKKLKNDLRLGLNLDNKVSGKELLTIIKETTPNCKNYDIINNIINDYINYLAIGISNLINIFEPEVIGIGGSFVFYKEVLLERLQNELLNKNLLFNKREKINIVTAKYNNDAGIIGSIL